MIYPTDSMDFFKYLVASHVTESGALQTEPGAVIKLRPSDAYMRR